MASPGLATNRDASYADSGSDPSVKLHQQDHDLIGVMLNRHDNVNATVVGQGLVTTTTGSSTLYTPMRVVLGSWWNTGTLAYEPAKPSWASGLFGWTFFSTNSAAAAEPNGTNGGVNLAIGDIWQAHPDAA